MNIPIIAEIKIIKIGDGAFLRSFLYKIRAIISPDISANEIKSKVGTTSK